MVKHLIDRKEIKRRIVAVPSGRGGYIVKHDIPGESILCEVHTLEMAGCIVEALRYRAALKIAQELLHEHETRKKSKYAKRSTPR